MECTYSVFPYADTNYFTPIILDYLRNDPQLEQFYRHKPDISGISASIESRKKLPANRELLVAELIKVYSGRETDNKTGENIEKLRSENTFTVCTAHQPAIFTGTLYFIYKILHTVRLCEELEKEFPEYNFVPVYYMGSEDADLEELGNIYLNGSRLSWHTRQTGAVGRMNTRGLEELVSRIEGELGVDPYGSELISLLKDAYLKNTTVQEATFSLLHRLFAKYGLVILIPDNPSFKKEMKDIFFDDLLNQKPAAITGSTIERLSERYRIQANPREINLFYLQENSRERIEKTGEEEWSVVGADIKFDRQELLAEFENYPERFSPNVILRGLMQEKLLPNIIFVGGGGELAYWMEYRDLFENYGIPYPVLVLRNSFLVIESKWKEKMNRLGISVIDMFLPKDDILKSIIFRDSEKQLSIKDEQQKVEEIYEHLKDLSGKIDHSLIQHVEALKTRSVKGLRGLEKKMIRAEKRKFDAENRQVQALKDALFPVDSLQERVETFMPFYSRYGYAFIDLIYANSGALEQQFGVLEIGKINQ